MRPTLMVAVKGHAAPARAPAERFAANPAPGRENLAGFQVSG